MAANALGIHFAAPHTLTLPPSTIDLTSPPPTDSTDGWQGALALGGNMVLRSDGAGRLHDIEFEDGPAPAELRASLVTAAWQADTAGDLRDALVSDSVVRLAVEAVPRPDRRDAGLIRIRYPYIRITQPVVPRNQPRPDYPGLALADSEDGSVDLQYVVDEDGFAIPASIKVLKGSGRFVPSAIRTILRSQFTPPKSGSCPVRQLVQQRVSYRMHRGR